MFWNKNKPPRNNRNITLNKADYGRVIVSYIVLNHGEEFKELSRKYNKWEFVDYLAYLRYLTFLSQKILETRYSAEDVSLIINFCISSLVGEINIIPRGKKSDMERILKNQYQLLVEYAEMDVYSENGLHELVDMFLGDIGDEGDSYYHLTFFADFALFIKHHAGSLLDNRVTVI